jgi:hypothetical protein
MSDNHDHDHGHEKFPQEEDVIPTGKTSGVLVILCVLTVGCCIWAFLLLRHQQGKIDGDHLPVEANRQKQLVGRKTGVDQTLFRDGRSYSDRFMIDQKEQLQGYGWVDKDKGVVHVPIDQAMQRVIAEEGAK